MDKKIQKNALVKKWFHSYTFDSESETGWQGQVVAEIGESYFLVQLYDWAMGKKSQQKVCGLNDMVHWEFYNSDKEMRGDYEKKSKK